MMPIPLVSVIIPNYNHARFLDQRIQSVLNQTYQNFEVIILDDKSTDNSKVVIEKYQDNPHVAQIIYNEENSGSTFKQWDKGIRLAKGELIWIAESDDYCEDVFLSKLVREFQLDQKVGLAYCNIKVVDAEGRLRQEFNFNTHNDVVPAGSYKGITFINNYLYKECYIWNASAVLFSKKYALSITPYYTTLKTAGDYVFWMELSSKCKVVKKDAALNYFRIHNTNVTPISKTSGLKSKEIYDLYHHLANLKLLKGINRIEFFLLNANDAINQKYDSESIRRELRSLWDPFHLMSPHFFGISLRFVSLLSRVLHKC